MLEFIQNIHSFCVKGFLMMRIFSYLSIFIMSSLLLNAEVFEITKGVPFVEVKDHGKMIKIQ